MRRLWMGAMTMVAGGVLLTGCAAKAHAPSVDQEVSASHAWARPTPSGASNAAVYLTITSPNGDQLTSVAVDPKTAARTSMHETTTMSSMTGDGHNDGHNDGPGGGMTSMHPVKAVDLPAGEAVTFEPGGLHVMLEELASPLEQGDTFPLTLEFATAPPVTVTVEVRDS